MLLAKENNWFLMQILTFLIKLFFLRVAPLKSESKMNLQAIRANKDGLVEVDSRLPGPSNFIVDFTFSPLLSECCFFFFVSFAFALTIFSSRRGGQTTRDTLLTLILLPPSPAERESAAECPRFQQQPFAGFPYPRESRGNTGAQSLLVRNFKTLSFHWITQKSYGQICFISTGGLLHLTECNYSCFRRFSHFNGDLFAIENSGESSPLTYIFLKRYYIILKM